MDDLLSMFQNSAKTFVSTPGAEALGSPSGSPSVPAAQAVDSLFAPLKSALSSMEEQLAEANDAPGPAPAAAGAGGGAAGDPMSPVLLAKASDWLDRTSPEGGPAPPAQSPPALLEPAAVDAAAPEETGRSGPAAQPGRWAEQLAELEAKASGLVSPGGGGGGGGGQVLLPRDWLESDLARAEAKLKEDGKLGVVGAGLDDTLAILREALEETEAQITERGMSKPAALSAYAAYANGAPARPPAGGNAPALATPANPLHPAGLPFAQPVDGSSAPDRRQSPGRVESPAVPLSFPQGSPLSWEHYANELEVRSHAVQCSRHRLALLLLCIE